MLYEGASETVLPGFGCAFGDPGIYARLEDVCYLDKCLYDLPALVSRDWQLFPVEYTAYPLSYQSAYQIYVVYLTSYLTPPGRHQGNRTLGQRHRGVRSVRGSRGHLYDIIWGQPI